ncbi:Formylglycine-generating enzyme, required for sulfatase activity, contains SUMF1/FGE domain [Halpernia humi]|uniref:Formylglycine-generating enzyme, required for sulfatase activity, contains SUMF1/FGE domain n=1 Tax=Halpernia humi TaxID=493375 RepID=A0A1H5ZMU9_9FLAO|nr:SUMF1/EgtB/PvdO family nonheme iron enzyme [Halpernia humi]SEG37893.1 Formylglycine-generating enzyme, required for sulfatase activity, contains SUMF1/FGE domain [Halpernia humi]
MKNFITFIFCFFAFSLNLKAQTTKIDFYDDFSDGSKIKWANVPTGNELYYKESGRYIIEYKQGKGGWAVIRTFKKIQWYDLNVELTVNVLEGNSPGIGVGFVLGNFATDGISYRFVIQPDGTYAFGYFKDNAVKYIIPFTASKNILKGNNVDNKLKIKIQNKKAFLYINYQLVNTVTLPEPITGEQIALYSGKGQRAAFDNMRVEGYQIKEAVAENNLQQATYPEMVTVEGGTFTMGDEHGDGDEYSDEHEKPTHQVTLKTFKIAKTETTVAQWKVFCNATGRSMPEEPSWGWDDSHPIVNVSWQDAVAYCNWLSEKMDADYRLPTEAEWEFAARGGNKSKGYEYSGSNDLVEVGEFDIDGSGGYNTITVAINKPNELGIYDMSGNVWEWCNDWSGSYRATAQTNPRGATNGVRRIVRGGSAFSSYIACPCCLSKQLRPL